jgi:hypothetical protein
MRHLFRGTAASPSAAVQHNARVCSLDVEGVETAWELPVRGPRQPHTISKPQRAPFAVSHRPGRAGGGAVPGSQGECTQGSDEREPVAGHRHRKSGGADRAGCV